MSKLKKWWKAGAVVVLALVTLQVAVSLLARTRRVHAYLTAHLERAFGRPVEVGSFGARIFPSLELYADGVTGGCASNPRRYCPDDNATRGEMATFLTRTYNLPLP